MNAPQTKAGFIAIIGVPNAGKSTLMNCVLGEKLAIVTPKVQTTRFNLRGILTENNTQYIFVDTPGIHKARRMFDQAMVDAAWQAGGDADVLLVVVDVRKGFDAETMQLMDVLKELKKPAILALNKIDGLPKEKLLPLMADAGKLNLFDKIFAISAKKGHGVKDLLATIASYMPQSPYLYDPEDITDLPMRLLAAEMTRERAFLLLGQELPYSLTVETVSYTEQLDGSVRIEQNLMVERDGQKKIVIGKNGQMLKKIGTQARTALSDIMGCPVHLFLNVKVSPGWASNHGLMRELGLLQPSAKK